ncbi:sensory transduction protein LytR [Lachnospiraceae bacterium]|nr:LytTR family DNA-binding domain-containing protein [Acetatifactor sp.]GFH95897.1 sensory transduction protein LytR [Lachnospiraceae bacterium]
MRVRIEIEDGREEVDIIVKCGGKSAYIDRLAAAMYMVDRQIMVSRDGEVLPLDLGKVLYMESVDGRCFVYTRGEVYETGHRLYELEQQLGQYLFSRINKSAIVNLEKIQSIRTYVNRRLLLTMENGEQLIASRQYAENIKGLLGINGRGQ